MIISLGTGIEVVYTNFNNIEEEGNQWWLHVYREASKEDVVDGEAEPYIAAAGRKLCGFSKLIIDQPSP